MVGTQVQEALGTYIADHYLAPLPGITGAYPCPDFNAPAHPLKWAQAHKTALLQGARVSVPRFGGWACVICRRLFSGLPRQTSLSRTQQHAGYPSLHLCFGWALLLLNACFPSSALSPPGFAN